MTIPNSVKIGVEDVKRGANANACREIFAQKKASTPIGTRNIAISDG